MTQPEDQETIEGRMKDLQKVFEQNDQLRALLSQQKTPPFDPMSNKGCVFLLAWTAGLILAAATGVVYWFLQNVLEVLP